MALYIPHSIFHLARLLYVRPENFWTVLRIFDKHSNIKLHENHPVAVQTDMTKPTVAFRNVRNAPKSDSSRVPVQFCAPQCITHTHTLDKTKQLSLLTLMEQ